ncbi:hypothetical protein ES332_D05G367300v1 [Gossypium tomentosum]|uniref:Uncharacterized protein n=1 Tax=Gossypium tomentosum TaxID=34277 RepID=A0A5D2L3V3_GOSTO|nr:hypothetical protein ES332_D05G367300v1 [Gossypium tomentosum]
MRRSSPPSLPLRIPFISTTERRGSPTPLATVWALENVGCARGTCCDGDDNRWRKNGCCGAICGFCLHCC